MKKKASLLTAFLICMILLTACSSPATPATTEPAVVEPTEEPAVVAPTEAPAVVEPTAEPAVVEPTEAPADPLSGEDLDALVAAAKAEGSVVVYSFTSRIARIETAFEEAYPGIDLVGADMSSTEMITRLKAEADAGSIEADVAYISDAPVVFGELIQSEILQPYVPPQFADRVPQQYQTPLLANRISTKVLMYNEESYPDGSPITNLWQLTQPEWAGKVIIVDPLVRGDYLDLMTEIVLRSDEMAAAYEELFGTPITLDEGIENAGQQFIKALFANDLILVSSTDDVNASVGLLGQTDAPVGFTSYSDRRDNEDEGWALQVANNVAPSNGISFPALLGIVNGAKHPAAARLLIHFMMGDDSTTGGPGYAPFYVAGDYATRTDIEPHPDAVPFAELSAWYIDPIRSYEIRADVADFILALP